MKISERRLRHIIKSVIEESKIKRPDSIGDNVSVKEGDKVKVKKFPVDKPSEKKLHGKVGEVVKTEMSRDTGISYCDVKFGNGKVIKKIFCTKNHIEKVGKEEKLSEQKLRKAIRQIILEETTPKISLTKSKSLLVSAAIVLAALGASHLITPENQDDPALVHIAKQEFNRNQGKPSGRTALTMAGPHVKAIQNQEDALKKVSTTEETPGASSGELPGASSGELMTTILANY